MKIMIIRLRNFFSFFLSMVAVPLLSSCGGSGDSRHFSTQQDTLEFRYASNLKLIDKGEFTEAVFRNPWDTTRTLQTYLLVPRGGNIPQDLPNGVVVRVPLQRSIVYTSMLANLIDEFGATDVIKGACDAKYMYKAPIRQRIESGTIVDCGMSRTPNIEMIISLRPDAILLSAFENSNDHNKVSQLGIPIIDCIDYMETSPLGRAEWMRFYGRLLGKGSTADSLFLEVEKAYLATKSLTVNVTYRPKVLTDLIYGQGWHVPGGNSFVGVLIQDAGGINPFAHYKKAGSVKLAPEEVLYTANDADFWLIKYSQRLPATLTQLAADNPIYARFNAFDTGEVYGCNSDNSSYFEDAAFHPHWILAEYVNILHPELGVMEDNHHYYNKLRP